MSKSLYLFLISAPLLMGLAKVVTDGANAWDQPIKRTELISADVADVTGKETVIYIADVMPGAEGQGIPIMAMSSLSWKAHSLLHQMGKSLLP